MEREEKRYIESREAVRDKDNWRERGDSLRKRAETEIKRIECESRDRD